MSEYIGLFRLAVVAVAMIAIADLGGCAPRTPEITRHVLGLDATGRPVVSYTTCEYYGFAGTLGHCSSETPPVVWCYQTVAAHDCYRTPDRLATRYPEPTIDDPRLPKLYALPSPPSSKVELLNAPSSNQPNDIDPVAAVPTPKFEMPEGR